MAWKMKYANMRQKLIGLLIHLLIWVVYPKIRIFRELKWKISEVAWRRYFFNLSQISIWFHQNDICFFLFFQIITLFPHFQIKYEADAYLINFITLADQGYGQSIIRSEGDLTFSCSKPTIYADVFSFNTGQHFITLPKWNSVASGSLSNL